MLLAGLWCSTQKPPSFSFLEPVISQLKDLEEKGMYLHAISVCQNYIVENLVKY